MGILSKVKVSFKNIKNICKKFEMLSIKPSKPSKRINNEREWAIRKTVATVQESEPEKKKRKICNNKKKPAKCESDSRTKGSVPEKSPTTTLLEEQRVSREDARAAVPDQQMRSERPRYPVDRYLVESSKKVEMVNIIDDDIWNPEPALRPEDEIILRKLHDMLQSTADDLKLLSGELSKYHEPEVQVKMLPTPLDDEFNEKVHIEEVVNAKFHGNKIIDNLQYSPELKLNDKSNRMKAPVTKSNACVQVNSIPTVSRPSKKTLEMTRTKVIQIDERNQDKIKENKLNNAKGNNKLAAVNYREFSYEYRESKEDTKKLKLNVQIMPSINIRSELTEHKVLHLNILPEVKEAKELSTNNGNVAVITLQHEAITDNKSLVPHVDSRLTQGKIRKISRMSTGDSSSANSANYGNMHKPIKVALKSSPKSSYRIDNSKKHKMSNNKSSDKKAQSNLEKWRSKLNTIYGQPSTSRKNTMPKTRAQNTSSNKKGGVSDTHASNVLNKKAEYIPYSQLTLGGVSVSDVEREIFDIPDKNQLPLSPILDKLLSSRENSFNNSSKTNKEDNNTKILTTSDENLLQEVIDIEKSVAETLKRNLKNINITKEKTPNNSESNGSKKAESYADDFEDEKSDGSKNSAIQNSSDDVLSLNESPDLESEKENNIEKLRINNEPVVDNSQKVSKSDIHNRTYTKKSNLSFKNKVDIFEFVHSVDTQESGTQSTASHIIALKETQTSPRNEQSNIAPIHNDLWPSIDPKGEISHILKLEKDFIKKLIIDEYGDLLEKNITKPSTSKETEDTQNNIVSFQKNTQTSPAHVKSVMTSPTRTKTRTTSPFNLSVPVDRQTSPMIYVTKEEALSLQIENVEEDLGISINLSSPRFSLRLPQNSREVLSNFEESNNQTPSKVEPKEMIKTFRKFTVSSSSSSVDADNSSSDISSLGEIKLRLKRRLRKCRVSSISDSSSSSVLSHCSSDLQTMSILPLRSEGEVSLGQAMKINFKKRDSDGEIRRLS